MVVFFFSSPPNGMDASEELRSDEGPRLGFLLSVPLDVGELWIKGGIQVAALAVAPAERRRFALSPCPLHTWNAGAQPLAISGGDRGGPQVAPTPAHRYQPWWKEILLGLQDFSFQPFI